MPACMPVVNTGSRGPSRGRLCRTSVGENAPTQALTARLGAVSSGAGSQGHALVIMSRVWEGRRGVLQVPAGIMQIVSEKTLFF